MLEIAAKAVGKRFVREWIFRNYSHHFQSGQSFAITGPNGSGKSTLAQILSGFTTPTTGEVSYTFDGTDVPVEEMYQYLVFAAPYVDLIDELTLEEMITFHFKMKDPVEGLDIADVSKIMQLEKSLHKEIRNFSSGMRQRLKLGLAFTTQSEMVILDEPTTNLDETGVQWYLEQVNRFCKDKLLIISSNQQREYAFCDEVIDLMAFKRPASP